VKYVRQETLSDEDWAWRSWRKGDRHGESDTNTRYKTACRFDERVLTIGYARYVQGTQHMPQVRINVPGQLSLASCNLVSQAVCSQPRSMSSWARE
jgi:hypothetical protein